MTGIEKQQIDLTMSKSDFDNVAKLITIIYDGILAKEELTIGAVAIAKVINLMVNERNEDWLTYEVFYNLINAIKIGNEEDKAEKITWV